MGTFSFDETVKILLEQPAEFRKLCSLNPRVLELRGLHNETLLHFLAVEGEATAVALLGELGANVNATNNYGDTALHDCVAFGNVDLCTLLLSLGANPNHQNAQGYTALHTAFENNTGDHIFQMLLKAGGNMSLKNNYGQTPGDSFLNRDG
jgi:ankyrin repeat protein